MAKNQNLLEIENARLIFKNFAGKERKNPKNGQTVNAEGARNFCVVIDADAARQLKADGWNVRTYASVDDEYDEPLYYIKVSVRYDKGIPPKVWMITKRNRTLLNADTIDSLDYADIRQADIRIRPRQWDINGGIVTSAYLQEMYVVIEEDKWEEKYAEYTYPEE